MDGEDVIVFILAFLMGAVVIAFLMMIVDFV
jgi:hypothetical protein